MAPVFINFSQALLKVELPHQDKYFTHLLLSPVSLEALMTFSTPHDRSGVSRRDEFPRTPTKSRTIHIRWFEKRVEHGGDQQKSDTAASVYMLLVVTVSWLLRKETESCLCQISSKRYSARGIRKCWRIST